MQTADGTKQVTQQKKGDHFNPTQFIVSGFLVIIFIGACLLTLPISSATGETTPFIDALFTSTSAVCVTGLVVVNTLEHWSVFGHIIILILIQIGGLGFMTVVTMVLMVAKKRITLKERILIQESLNQNSISGMVKLVRHIVIGTIHFEGIGAALLSICFIPRYGIIPGIGMGIFHSISAFCNAGFDIIGTDNLVPYVGDAYVNFVIMALIIIGGLGFTVWVDVLRVNRKRQEEDLSLRKTIRKLGLHSKVVLTITPILIFGGAFFLFLCEYNNPETIGNMPLGTKLLASLFQSVTTRTAGFNSISQDGMRYSSKLICVILMFIGGSPSGTAGGIKTATIGVLIIAVLSVVRGSRTTSIYERSIAFETLQKALAIFLISLGVLIVITVLLTFTEINSAYDYEFIDLLFESSSALGTTGLSTGITPYLSTAGKLIVSLAMYMGRIGPISIAVALAKKQHQNLAHFEYPEGKIMVG